MTKMQIDLENTDIGDLYVSVWDRNQAGEPKILDAQRLNKGDRTPVNVEIDGDNYYSIRWYAERTDDSGKNKKEDVRDDSSGTVEVTTYFS